MHVLDALSVQVDLNILLLQCDSLELLDDAAFCAVPPVKEWGDDNDAQVNESENPLGAR